MAPRKTGTRTNASNSPLTITDTPMDYKAALRPSEGLQKVTRTRDTSENPLTGAVQDGVALALDVASSDQARQITSYLRRDASANGLGVQIQYKAGGEWVKTDRVERDGKTVTVYPEGITEVHFLGKAKAARKYTAADIRLWAQNEGLMSDNTDTGRIPADVREQYKRVHGYAKVDTTA